MSETCANNFIGERERGAAEAPRARSPRPYDARPPSDFSISTVSNRAGERASETGWPGRRRGRGRRRRVALPALAGRPADGSARRRRRWWWWRALPLSSSVAGLVER